MIDILLIIIRGGRIGITNAVIQGGIMQLMIALGGCISLAGQCLKWEVTELPVRNEKELFVGRNG